MKEELQTTIDKLIDYIDKAVSKNSVTNTQVAAVLDFLNTGLKNVVIESSEKYIRKDQEDSTVFLLKLLGGVNFGNDFGITSKGIAAFLNVIAKGIQSANFSTGVLGSGFTIKTYENGETYLEVDRALFRKSATFIEVLIQSLKHVGGQIILTPASMHCIKVEEKDNCYRCYFRNSDGDTTIYNEFSVGAFARSQTFNIKEGISHNVSNSYYWRKVIAIGDDYIDLSKDDCDTGSTIPQSGDDIVQLGHDDTDKTQQSAIILSAFGEDAPYFKAYRGINSYSLSGKEVVTISRSEVMIIADKFKFSTGESVKDYIDGMITTTWKEGKTYNAGVTLSFCNYLVKANKQTSNPPCAINQDENGNYLTNKDGSYIVTIGSNGKPIMSADWNVIQDNNEIVTEARKYTDAQFTIASDKINSKVEQQEFDRLGNRVSTAESSITQQAEAIALRVTKTVYDKGIEDAQLNSQQYAEAKATLAEQHANAKTEETRKALQDAIDDLDTAKANADDVYSKAIADGMISDSEANAIAAANAAAEAAKQLAVTTANAYADGVVSDEEKRAIQDATDKANTAKTDAINAAKADATTRADAAQSVAISSSKSYTDSQIAITNESIALKASKETVTMNPFWIEGKKYVALSTCYFGNILFQAIADTYDSPCEMLMSNDYQFLLTSSGEQILPCGPGGKPFYSWDWKVVINNQAHIDEVKSYTDSQIKITSDKIESKVSNSTYTIDKAGNEARVSKVESSITQQAESIALKVSQKEVDDAQSSTENKIKKALKDTGIDIDLFSITLTANKMLLQSNDGQTFAIFEIGEDGIPRLKAQYISADGISAKDVTLFGKFSSSVNGNRIEIDPSSNSLRMFDTDGNITMDILIDRTYPTIRLSKWLESDTLWPSAKMEISPYRIECKKTGSTVYRLDSSGLTFYKDGATSPTKIYGNN